MDVRQIVERILLAIVIDTDTGIDFPANFYALSHAQIIAVLLQNAPEDIIVLIIERVLVKIVNPVPIA